MEGIEALMKHIYLFNVVGLALGLIFGAVAYLAGLAMPQGLVAILIIIAIYKLCGINHIDGLADFGDGVIAHGSVEKKIAAMKDVYMGTGAAVFMAVMLLAMYSAISGMTSALLPLAMIAAEVSAKQSMITFAAFSTSLQKGLGQMMIERSTGKDFAIGIVIAALICAGALGTLGLAVLAISQVAALYMILVSKRNFGGSNGDGIGATNEVCRAVALSAALALGGYLPWMLW